MIDLRCLAGVKIALLIMDYSESADGQGYLVDGVGKIRDGKLFLDRGTDTDFPVPEDTYHRIRPVTSVQAEVVGDAKFLLVLTAGPQPEIMRTISPLAFACRAAMKMPNQAPEPTATLVTIRAGARLAPSASVAHL